MDQTGEPVNWPDRLRYAGMRADAISTVGNLGEALFSAAHVLEQQPPYVIEAIGRALAGEPNR